MVILAGSAAFSTCWAMVTDMAGALTRSVKELFVPPTDYRYPHMG